MELNMKSENFRIFFDEKSIDTGDDWLDELGEAIKSSKCLVAIWSPEYFNSSWCLTEFNSFLKRQEQLNRKGLIIPASFHDGEHFPNEAKAIQYLDFSNYANTISAFWNSSDAVEFEKIIKKYSKDIADKIKNAPLYQPDFPFEKKDNNEGTLIITRIS
jgi:hypothetical protein